MKKQSFRRIVQFMLVGIVVWAGIRIYDYVKADQAFDRMQEAFLEEVQVDATDEATRETEDLSEAEPEKTTKREDKQVDKQEDKHEDQQEDNVDTKHEDEEDKSKDEVSPLVQGVRNLHEQYPDVVGRIRLEGTVLDYPIVQGDDNEFYLNHDYTGEYHGFGAIFLDRDNKLTFEDPNSVVYGHNVRTGKMFDPLAGYLEADFLEDHPVIEIITLDEVKQYRVFAAYLGEPEAAYRYPTYSPEGWERFETYVSEKNVLDTEAPMWGDNNILTLSSCLQTWNRMVVHAELIMDET